MCLCPLEYVKLLEGLVSSWRIFAKKREVHVRDDNPSYPKSSIVDALPVHDPPITDENFGVETFYSPPNSPSTSASLLSPPSSAANGTVSAGLNASSSASRESSRVSDSSDNVKQHCGLTKRYRKARAYFLPHHIHALESFYEHQTYLSTHDRELLARRLGLSEDRVGLHNF